jgi:uncharacterized protein YjbI with pentapeptide repeats
LQGYAVLVGLGVVFLALAGAIGYVSYLQDAGSLEASLVMTRIVKLFGANVAADLAGIGIGILIVDQVIRIVDRRRNRESALTELRSGDGETSRRGASRLEALKAFHDGSLEGTDLSLADLSGTDLSKARLKGADLLRATLPRSLTDADLRGAFLTGAVLDGVYATGARFDGAQMSAVGLRNAHLTGTSFKGVIFLEPTSLCEANALRQTIMPDGTRYDGRYQLPDDLGQALSTNYDLSDVRAGSEFYEVSEEAYREALAFASSKLPVLRAIRQLRSKDLDAVQVELARLREMAALDLSNEYLGCCILTGMDLRGFDLTEAEFSHTNLEEADLSSCSLERADLSRAILTKANLQGAKLKGADLHASTLTGAAITEDQLRVCSRLWGAVLPDGTKYDGRFNIWGDVHNPISPHRGTPTGNDPSAIADYYGVTIKQYLEGQEWARVHGIPVPKREDFPT